MTSTSILGMIFLLRLTVVQVMTDVLTKCDCAGRFILAWNQEKRLQKVNKVAGIKEYTQVMAEL
jgi:hypothetical protein